MIRMFLVALAVTSLFIAGCGQEQPAAPAQPKTEMKPTAGPAPAAPPGAPVAAPSTPPTEAAKPVAPAQEVPKAAEVAKAPETPAAPAKPTATAPAVKTPDVADTLVLPASQGQVTLPHLAHAKLFPCATCHGEGTPGKIELTKDTAHALCRECHKTKGAGPTTCGDCHKK